jgi:hypothetical protein
MALMLASPAIPPGGEIPSEYTCDGADISPSLTWSGLPNGTQSLVIVVEDPDAPSGVFRHGTAFDIPAGSRGLDAGYSATRLSTGFHEAHTISASPVTAAHVRPRAMGPTTIISACSVKPAHPRPQDPGDRPRCGEGGGAVCDRAHRAGRYLPPLAHPLGHCPTAHSRAGEDSRLFPVSP